MGAVFENYYSIISPKNSDNGSMTNKIISGGINLTKQVSNNPDDLTPTQSHRKKAVGTPSAFYNSPPIKVNNVPYRKISAEDEDTITKRASDNFSSTAFLSQVGSAIMHSKGAQSECHNVLKHSNQGIQKRNTVKFESGVGAKMVISKNDIKMKNQKQQRKSLAQSKKKKSIQMENISEEDQIDYSKYMEPVTERIYEFKTKRVEFRRRPSYKESQILIMHFEGVLGGITQKDIEDANYNIVLRHGLAQGMAELAKFF